MKKKRIVVIIAVILLVILISNICFANSVIKNTYKLDENIIYRILPDTNLDEFKEHIANNAEIQIENNVIGTGKTAIINEKEYKLVVCGDITGDGKITKTDVDSIKDHILEKSTLSELAFKAADINGDGSITASELTKISKYQQGYEVEFYKKDISEDFEYIKDTIENTSGVEEEIDVTYELNADEDSDGLTNEEELNYGTDIAFEDTDGDGLSDYEEVKNYGTNPLEKDTDKDGIDDLNEIQLNLNPLEKDSDGNGVNDNEEIINHVEEDEELGVKLDITGDANISNTIISTVEIDELDSVDAIVSPIYDFNTSGNINNADVVIKYNEADISAKEISEENLSLYNFDPVNYTFDEIETIIDTTNNTAKATLEHFSMYVLADKTTMVDSVSNQILFVIDNSASMYTYEQALEKSADESTLAEDLENTPANDPEYKRLDIVSNIINNLDSKFEYGLVKFTSDYGQLAQMGSSKEKIQEGLEKIKTDKEKFNGTYIGATLYTASYEFSEKKGVNKYIVLITDGASTEPSQSIIKDMAIQNAKDHNVKIITIGLGSQVDLPELIEYSSETGGSYYHVDGANMLDNIQDSLNSKLNLNRTQITNSDGTVGDYLVIADSGFSPRINGLPFANYITSLSDAGHCYGIAKLARLLYTNNLELEGANVEKQIDGIKRNFNYDISELSFFRNNNKNLGNYTFENKDLEKIYMSSNEELYNFDLYKQDIKSNAENAILKMKDEYKEIIEGTNGLIEIATISKKIDGYGRIKVELPKLNMNEITEEKINEYPDLQLFKALEYLYVSQFDNKGNTLSSLKTKIDSEETFEKLLSKINAGDPVMINYLEDTSDGVERYLQTLIGKKTNHAVTGIKVLVNANDTTEYKLAIYNNNTPKETEYLTINKKKDLFGNISYEIFLNKVDKRTNMYATF